VLVVEAIRRRAQRGAQLDNGSLQVRLGDDERRQVARLLGTSWDVSGRPVSLQALGRGLAEHGFTVRQFVEALDGRPMVARRDAVAAEQRATEEERSRVVEVLGSAGIAVEAVEAWFSRPGAPRLGTGKASALANGIAGVWPRLPWTGPPTRLAALAALATGDAHGLDYATDLGRAVARLIAATAGVARPTRPGREWRAAWAAAGVRCDTVSSRVLTLNVPLDITAGHRRGAPLWLTLRDLIGSWRFAPAPTRLCVCENPTVVEAAADELGAGCAPLVCTDGVPSLAALDLVAGAADLGIDIHVRADFDPTGFVIVDTLRSVAPAASTWRFDTDTYAAYFDLAPDGTTTAAQLRDRHGHDLHEEALLPSLLDDLGSHGTVTV
jgi:uncharacterized protein (TIGR02679 family)